MTQEIPLDNPAWHALTGRHQDAIAVRHGRAARYRSDVSVIAALEKGVRSAFDDLAQIVAVGETIGVIVDPGKVLPKDWQIVDELLVIQMICDGLTNERLGDCVLLGEGDIPEMMALAKLTNPGPFDERTIDMVDMKIGFIGLFTSTASMALQKEDHMGVPWLTPNVGRSDSTAMGSFLLTSKAWSD